MRNDAIKVKSYSRSKAIKGVCKSDAFWAMDGNVSFPLFYLRRPKWIKDDKAWEMVVDSITLRLPRGTEIK